MCVRVCVCVCVYEYLYVRARARLCVYVCARVYVCVRERVCVRAYEFLRARARVCVCACARACLWTLVSLLFPFCSVSVLFVSVWSSPNVTLRRVHVTGTAVETQQCIPCVLFGYTSLSTIQKY
jgi:hypothetical protein